MPHYKAASWDHLLSERSVLNQGVDRETNMESGEGKKTDNGLRLVVSNTPLQSREVVDHS